MSMGQATVQFASAKALLKFPHPEKTSKKALRLRGPRDVGANGLSFDVSSQGIPEEEDSAELRLKPGGGRNDDALACAGAMSAN